MKATPIVIPHADGSCHWVVILGRHKIVIDPETPLQTDSKQFFAAQEIAQALCGGVNTVIEISKVAQVDLAQVGVMLEMGLLSQLLSRVFFLIEEWDKVVFPEGPVVRETINSFELQIEHLRSVLDSIGRSVPFSNSAVRISLDTGNHILDAIIDITQEIVPIQTWQKARGQIVPMIAGMIQSAFLQYTKAAQDREMTAKIVKVGGKSDGN